MKKVTQISGKSIPLRKNDIDTDLIIPAQYLTAVTKKGYGENLFRRLRDSDPHFVLNQEKYKNANILISLNNFGCGSSREHAVWALTEAGIECVIAASFADIFAGNSAKNGLLLITLPIENIEKLLQDSENTNLLLTIDIENQKIKTSENNEYFFEINEFYKYCLINGLDTLDYLLNHAAEIRAFEENR